ncbi:HD domain-containing protein [Candidatus Microgenomates bacterium]|nr:HD domain-containing protein [Candidatus Microgenomates bacterium]
MVTEKIIARETFIDRIYGEMEITDPLALEIIESPTLQRLKHIQQMGTYNRALPHINTTRFEHSLGVYYLLGRFGASREEQIAGLLHDVSHTVFSHVMDHMIGDQLEQNHQDNIQHDFILNSEIPRIIRRHHVDHEVILDDESYKLLDQKLPDLCADRLDYGIRDSVVCGVTNPDQTAKFLDHLHFIDGKWVFDDVDVARDYTEMSMKMAERWWAPAWGVLQFKIMSEALRLGLDSRIITYFDLFSTDDEVWNKLQDSGHEKIGQYLAWITNIHDILFEICEEEGADFTLQSKYRGVDPLVDLNHHDHTVIDMYKHHFVARISQLFPDFKIKTERLRQAIETPHYVRIIA